MDVTSPPTHLEKAHARMTREMGPLHLFPRTLIPLHTNRMGLSKSIDFETGMLLSNFVAWYKPETVCELGTFRGYSTAWLILGSYLTGKETQVHAFEVFNEGEYGRMWYDEFELPKTHFFYHTVPGGIWQHVSEVPPKIDMIFHDTEHMLGPTMREMDLLLPRLSAGGVVVIDDMCHPDYAGMQNYFYALFEGSLEWDWTVLRLGHGLGIAVKR